jgi:hypothetical protein
VVTGLSSAAGEAWAFRAGVERDAATRFARLSEAIPLFDPGSPVSALLRRAADDEVRHEALCADLAASYGQPVASRGTAPPIAPRSLGPRDAVLYEMVAACCIAETESVATVATLLSASAEARVRGVLHEIARDEVVHARMGWAHLAREAAVRDVSFLAGWVPAMLAGSAEDGLFSPPSPGDDGGDLLRHGVLPRARKREVFVQTLADVVFPGLDRVGVDLEPARAWLAARVR